MPYGSTRGRIRTTQAFMSPVDDARRNQFSIPEILIRASEFLFLAALAYVRKLFLFPALFPYIIIMTDNLENGNFCTEIISFPTSEAKVAFLRSDMLRRSAEASTLPQFSRPVIRFHTEILFRPY